MPGTGFLSEWLRCERSVEFNLSQHPPCTRRLRAYALLSPYAVPPLALLGHPARLGPHVIPGPPTAPHCSSSPPRCCVLRYPQCSVPRALLFAFLPQTNIVFP